MPSDGVEQKVIKYTLMKFKETAKNDKQSKERETKQDLKFVDDSDRETMLKDPKTGKEGLKWGNYEVYKLPGTGNEVKSLCTYDTKFVYQNDQLEKRYKEFKLNRDQYLLDEVPEDKTFEYQKEHENDKTN